MFCSGLKGGRVVPNPPLGVERIERRWRCVRLSANGRLGTAVPTTRQRGSASAGGGKYREAARAARGAAPTLETGGRVANASLPRYSGCDVIVSLPCFAADHRCQQFPHSKTTGRSDTCERYQRLAVSGWEHNRGRSKLREMKSDPVALAPRVNFQFFEAVSGDAEDAFTDLETAELGRELTAGGRERLAEMIKRHRAIGGSGLGDIRGE